MGLFGRLFGGGGKPSPPAPQPGAAHPPRRGLYTQCVCVLLDEAVELGAISACLDGFTVVREVPAAEGRWLGGPAVVVEYEAASDGYALVDVVDATWPDEMGSPDGPSADLFAAWAAGQFGPTTFPGALERATQHSRAWPEGAKLAARHGAFLRVRTSYALGAGPDAKVLPDDYRPVDELRFVTQLARPLLDVPGALALFNPNGELLTSAEHVDEALEREQTSGQLPVDVWANVRLFRVEGSDGREWSLFDTVGLEQAGVRDHEGAVPTDSASFDCVPGLLYTIANADVGNGGALAVGNTADDLAGGAWQARGEGESVVQPPRPVLRWSLTAQPPPVELDGQG